MEQHGATWSNMEQHGATWSCLIFTSHKSDFRHFKTLDSVLYCCSQLSFPVACVITVVCNLQRLFVYKTGKLWEFTALF